MKSRKQEEEFFLSEKKILSMDVWAYILFFVLLYFVSVLD